MNNSELSAPSESDYNLQQKMNPDLKMKDFIPALQMSTKIETVWICLVGYWNFEDLFARSKGLWIEIERLIANIIAHLSEDALLTLQQNDSQF